LCLRKERCIHFKGRARGGASICRRSTAKRLYPTIKIATDITSIFCSQKGQQTINGTEL